MLEQLIDQVANQSGILSAVLLALVVFLLFRNKSLTDKYEDLLERNIKVLGEMNGTLNVLKDRVK